MLLMTVSALACGALFAAPPRVGLSIVGIFLLFFTPTVLAIVVIYGSGYARTFAIGALVPLGVLFQAYSPYFLFLFMEPDFGGDSIVTRLIVAACLGGALLFLAINGGVAMLARWFLERSRGGRGAGAQARQPDSPFDDESTSV